MGIPANQIGNDPQSKLLWQISKQLENQTAVIYNSGGGGGGSFDGQLKQGGEDVSNTNPLPIKGGVADTTFQDSTGQLFVYRDNGINVPAAYKIPDWTEYEPVGEVTATSSQLTNYSLEEGGHLESIDTKIPALGQALAAASTPVVLPASQITALTPPTSIDVNNFPTTQAVSGPLTDTQLRAADVPVTVSNFPTTQPISASTLPLPSGAATATLQTTGNTSLDNINVAQGTIADSAYNGSGNSTEIAALKGLYAQLAKNNYSSSGFLKVDTAANSFSYSSNNSTNGNSSAFSLATANTWNGTIENAINQTYAIIGVVSNQNVTLTVSQFLDVAGLTKDVPDKTFAITAGVPYSLPFAVLGNYLRLSVSNTSGSTASLIVDTYYGNLPVAPDSLTQLGNFKNSINEVGGVAVPSTGILVTGRTGQPVVTPTVTASSAYVAGNIVGGLMTFSNCFATGLTSGVLQSIVIKSKSVQTTTFKLYIFSQQPTNTTWTDKTAPAINALDLPFLIDMFIFAAPDSGLGTMTIYTQDGLGKSIANTANGQNLFGVLVTIGTPTFTSTSDLSVTLGILQD